MNGCVKCKGGSLSSFIVKKILQMFLGDEINDIKYHLVYRELLGSLGLSLRRAAVRFNFFSLWTKSIFCKSLVNQKAYFEDKI